MFEYFVKSVQSEYSLVRILKESDRGRVSLLRHKATGGRYVFRLFEGKSEVYRSLINISCPNLPRIYEAAEAEGRTAVLEEYVQGDRLDFLLEGSLCSPAEARDIMLQLCRGVWVLHSLGAVHRDIKPENIILRGDEAVLVDFDASRIHKSALEEDTRVLGTMGYAAPEQYGFSQTDHRADIYSLGVLYNVMLTGQHPSRALAGGKPGRVIERCTMTNPARRWRDLLQLMDNL